MLKQIQGRFGGSFRVNNFIELGSVLERETERFFHLKKLALAK